VQVVDNDILLYNNGIKTGTKQFKSLQQHRMLLLFTALNTLC